MQRIAPTARAILAASALAWPCAPAVAGPSVSPQDPPASDAATPEPPAPPPAPRDSIRVRLPASSASLLDGGPRTGRMLVFLAGAEVPPGTAPSEAPFLDAPQPMFSVEVDELAAGRPVTIDATALSFPGPPDGLDGTFRLQAVFRRNAGERGHLGPGNLVSAPRAVTFSSTATDEVDVDLTSRIDAPPLAVRPNLRWFTLRSELLSRATGREVTMRAGVALPPGWSDPNHRRRFFPAVYCVPWFGARYTDAARLADRLADPEVAPLMAPAVHVVLDPEAPLGHHGFVDSAANGPWGTALVTELIPALEREFRLVSRPEARIVTGHSSGGWSSLWLQLGHPETFGACFASSPDPVDFSRFQTCDLYRDASLFTDGDGKERPMFRTVVAKGFGKPGATVRQAVAMERVLGPAHDSGEQWDTWSAMWSPLGPATRRPLPPCDGGTGAIDARVVAGSWSRYDIAALVRTDPAAHVPVLRERVRVLCGSDDDFMLERGVQGLREAAEAGADALMSRGQMLADGPGYVEVVPGLDHRSMFPAAAARWHAEMREHLRRHGLD